MSNVEFDTPANRIIAQQAPKNQFRIDTSLPDITFLRQLSVQGRLRYDFNRSIVSETNSITPANGETQFIYRLVFNLSGLNVSWKSSLQNDGMERAQFQFTNSSSEGSVTFTWDIIDSLVGDGIKSFDIVNEELTGNGALTVSVLSWVENTSRIRDVTT